MTSPEQILAQKITISMHKAKDKRWRCHLLCCTMKKVCDINEGHKSGDIVPRQIPEEEQYGKKE